MSDVPGDEQLVQTHLLRCALIMGMPFDKVAQAIELLGTEVAPVVRREMAKASPA